MQEERRMILRMLEEGKITAEEAEALLNALGDGAESSEDSEPQEDPWKRLEKMGEDFASKVEIAVERFSRSLSTRWVRSSPNCRRSWSSSLSWASKRPRSSPRWCGDPWAWGKSSPWN